VIDRMPTCLNRQPSTIDRLSMAARHMLSTALRHLSCYMPAGMAERF
jgi:hypothetical protein